VHYDTCIVTVKPILATGVTVNISEISLYVGETERLTATVFPDNATNRNVTWSSDNQSVVTVDDSGRITAVSVGTAVITVTTECGAHTSTTAVTVGTPYVPVTSITISPADITLYLGETKRLTAAVFPENATNRDIWWESDHNFITVDNYGLVTAGLSGTAIITARTLIGNYRGTTTVTVNVPIIDVTLNRTEGILTVGDNYTLVATVEPHNATNRNVTWHSGNTSIATVDTSGQVTAVSAGTTIITATAADGRGTFSATFAVKVRDGNISSSLDGVVIDGIRWATRNLATPGVFADNPEDVGGFFRWGTLGTFGSTEYSDNFTPVVPGWVNNSPDRVAWTVENDPCPAGWRVPTLEELEQLGRAVGNWSDWAIRNGVSGRYFGTAPNEIFLPAAGVRSPIGRLSGLDLGYVPEFGVYWSNTPSGFPYWNAQGLSVSRGHITWGSAGSNRASGHSIRCVAK
jgi:uncharacterized protein YjdB